MKKGLSTILILFIVICVCSIMIYFLKPHEKETTEEYKRAIFYNDYIADDFPDLDEVLTKEYDLKELQEFFESRSSIDQYILNQGNSVLKINEVNEKYPIEIIRTGNYSVYKVKQGGYFYVFWLLTTDLEANENEPSVSFTAYIPLKKDKEAFKKIKKGLSIKDVELIDPSFELNILLSHAIYSYSILSDDTLVEIQYSSRNGDFKYDNLIVEQVLFVPRTSETYSYGFSQILSKDLSPDFR